MEHWYIVATPRKEVREGRSFKSDEFAIDPERVIGKTAPEDYHEPSLFFARTSFTREWSCGRGVAAAKAVLEQCLNPKWKVSGSKAGTQSPGTNPTIRSVRSKRRTGCSWMRGSNGVFRRLHGGC